MKNQFDDIRPFCDCEISEGMQRISNHHDLQYISSFIYPDQSLESIKTRIQNIKTIKEFQLSIMYDAVGRLIDVTTSGLTYSGFEKIEKNKSYLFISNHRDIVLDPALLQWALISEKLPTSYISFGDNLLISQLHTDIAMSNKMFKVFRGGTMREMLANSQHLSDYIRMLITTGNSVWLAQRNGRTKDGQDATDQGILKMLSLSADSGKSNIESFAELNIVPMTISYENEPCDILKAREIYAKKINDGVYVKKAGEDQNSIMTGLQQQKGKVHISMGDRITIDDLKEYADLHINVLNHKIAEILDQKIRSNYHLMTTNYIANDVINNANSFADKYTESQKNNFIDRINSIVELEKDVDKKIFKDILLGIYANPVDSYLTSEK